LGDISNLTNSKRNLWSEWQTVFLFFAHRLWWRRQRANYRCLYNSYVVRGWGPPFTHQAKVETGSAN